MYLANLERLEKDIVGTTFDDQDDLIFHLDCNYDKIKCHKVGRNRVAINASSEKLLATLKPIPNNLGYFVSDLTYA